MVIYRYYGLINRKENDGYQQKDTADTAAKKSYSRSGSERSGGFASGCVEVGKWQGNSGRRELMYISNLYDISLDELIKGDDSVSRKIIADTNAKKWYKLNIIFFVLLLVNIMWFGALHGIWQAGLGIAAVSMIVISVRMLIRNRESNFLKL